MTIKLNKPEKRYGAIYVCTSQHIDKQCLKNVEIIEWADTLDELKSIEPIFKEWHRGVHEPRSNRNTETPGLLYGYSGYIVVDYQEKKILRRVGWGIPYFSDSQYDKLRLLDNLFTSDEIREITRKMDIPEYLGWLRFKYGDGLNAIHDDGSKPVDTKDFYEESLIREYSKIKYFNKKDKYIDETK